MNRKQIPAVILRNAYTFRKQCAFGGNYLSILFILHHLPLLSPLITTKPLQHFIVIDRLAQVLLGSQLLHDLLEMKRTSRCGYIKGEANVSSEIQVNKCLETSIHYTFSIYPALSVHSDSHLPSPKLPWGNGMFVV